MRKAEQKRNHSGSDNENGEIDNTDYLTEAEYYDYLRKLLV